MSEADEDCIECSSESEDDDDYKPTTSVSMKTTKTNEWWKDFASCPLKMRQIPCQAESVFLDTLPEEASPYQYFRLIVTDEWLDTLIKLTNTTQFKTDRKSLLTFIGLYIIMTRIQYNCLEDYWTLNSHFSGLRYFHNYMTAIEFKMICRKMFINSIKLSTNKYITDWLQTVLSMFNMQLSELYVPGKNLCFDNNHQSNFGNLLILFEPDGTVIHLFVYDKNATQKHKSNSEELTTDLSHLPRSKKYNKTSDRGFKNADTNLELTAKSMLQDYLNKGRSVYAEKGLVSHEMAKYLISKNTYMTGMVYTESRFNILLKFNGLAVNNQNTDVDEKSLTKYIFDKENSIYVGRWRESPEHLPAVYLTTEYDSSMIDIEVGKKKKITKTVPLAIAQYKECMHSKERQEKDVFSDDSILNLKPLMTMTRWYQRVILFTFKLAVVNAHTYFNKFSGYKMSYRDFETAVLEELLPEIEETEDIEEELEIKHKFINIGIDTEGSCSNCHQKTTKKCSVCDCSLCIDCFYKMHSIDLR